MQNGATTLDTLADNLKHVADYLTSHAASVRPISRSRSFVAAAGKTIKDHPIAAVGLAFGIGYLAVRIFRR